jgi:hypothetical protein
MPFKICFDRWGNMTPDSGFDPKNARGEIGLRGCFGPCLEKSYVFIGN